MKHSELYKKLQLFAREVESLNRCAKELGYRFQIFGKSYRHALMSRAMYRGICSVKRMGKVSRSPFRKLYIRKLKGKYYVRVESKGGYV